MSNQNEIISTDDETVNNYESQEETTQIVDENNSSENNSSEKKQKQTFEDFVTQHISEFDKFKTEFEGVTMKDFHKTFHKFLKSEEAFMGKLIKMHQKSQSKKFRKRTENTGKSGFNKPTTVPNEFVKYLELEEGAEMTRPQLVKLLNAKFNEDGFKNESEICISNKKVAKILNVEKDHKIHAKDYHKFIASYYEKSKNTTVVNVT